MVWGYGDDARVETAVEGLAATSSAAKANGSCRCWRPKKPCAKPWIAAQASRPVVIADTQDNPGGGGDSDTTGMLRALVACNAEGAAMGLMVDPAAAAAAHAAGAGA